MSLPVLNDSVIDNPATAHVAPIILAEFIRSIVVDLQLLGRAHRVRIEYLLDVLEDFYVR